MENLLAIWPLIMFKIKKKGIESAEESTVLASWAEKLSLRHEHCSEDDIFAALEKQPGWDVYKSCSSFLNLKHKCLQSAQFQTLKLSEKKDLAEHSKALETLKQELSERDQITAQQLSDRDQKIALIQRSNGSVHASSLISRSFSSSCSVPLPLRLQQYLSSDKMCSLGEQEL